MLPLMLATQMSGLPSRLKSADSEGLARSATAKVGCRNGASLVLEWHQEEKWIHVEMTLSDTGTFKLIIPENYRIAALPNDVLEVGGGTYAVAGKLGETMRFTAN